MPFEIKITKDYVGVKPKNFLKKRLNCPYYKIPKLISDKRITLNDKKIKKDDSLKLNDIIKVWLDELKLETTVKDLPSKDLGIKTIYENEDFLILNKTGKVSVQGGMNEEEKLTLHLQYLKQKNNDESDFNYFHVHRLDRQTSGALVIAKNRIALREFNKIFRERNVIKKYVCLCVGKFKDKKGKVEVLLKRTPQEVREKVIVTNAKDFEGRKSLSYYNVLKEYQFQGETFSLVEVEIKTGLTHQIRVHMKYLGHPIVGDYMYGNSIVNQMFESSLKRQFLHASYISFNFEEKKFEFEAPLLNDLKKILKIIE